MQNPSSTNARRSKWIAFRQAIYHSGFTKRRDAQFELLDASHLSERAHTFRSNVTMTWNVFEVAARLRVPRVVYASSFQVNNTAAPRTPIRFDYLPMDEEHPVSPQDDYGMSKWTGEHLGTMFAEHWGLTAVTFRFPWITMPEQQDLLPRKDVPEPHKHLPAYIYVRDAARACYLGVTADLPERSHTVLLVAAKDTHISMPSLEYARYAFPEAELRSNLDGYSALVNCARAADLLGFMPEYSCHD